MDISSSFVVSSSEEETEKLQKCKAFEDISKYFSEEEWGKLGYSEKTTYVYMKRNYETMTRLGLRASLPAFMCPKTQTEEFHDCISEDDESLQNQNEILQDVFNMQQTEQVEVMTKMPVKEENDFQSLTSDSDDTLEQPCSSEKASICDQECDQERTTMTLRGGSYKRQTSVWTCRLRERKKQIVYEEISDPDEDD